MAHRQRFLSSFDAVVVLCIAGGAAAAPAISSWEAAHVVEEEDFELRGYGTAVRSLEERLADESSSTVAPQDGIPLATVERTNSAPASAAAENVESKPSKKRVDGLYVCDPVRNASPDAHPCQEGDSALYNTRHVPIACCSQGCVSGSLFCAAPTSVHRATALAHATHKQDESGEDGRESAREEFEHEGEIDPVELAMAVMLLGGVAFVMMLFYLVNHSDQDIREYSWFIISTTISIFTSVLMFMGVDGIVHHCVHTYFVHSEVPMDILQLAVNYVHFLIWFVTLQWTIKEIAFMPEPIQAAVEQPTFVVPETSDDLASGIPSEEFQKNKLLLMKCWAVLLAHTAGFAAINAGGKLQHSFSFGESPAYAFSALLLQYLFLTVVFAVANSVRIHVHSNREYVELWEEQAEEAEDDMFSLCLSFLFMQAVRFALIGVLPDVMGLLPPHTVFTTQYVVGLSLCSFVCMLASAGFGLVKAILKPHEGSTKLRFFLVTQGTFANAFAWGLFYASKAWMSTSARKFVPEEEGLADPDNVSMRVMLACCLSAMALALIFVLDCIEDMHSTGAHAYKVIRSIMSAISILVGFSWEQAFERGGEVIADLTAKHGAWYPVITKFLLGFLLALGIIPAWRTHILNHTIRGIHNKEERLERRRQKATGKAAKLRFMSGIVMSRDASRFREEVLDTLPLDGGRVSQGGYTPVATEEPMCK